MLTASANHQPPHTHLPRRNRSNANSARNSTCTLICVCCTCSWNSRSVIANGTNTPRETSDRRPSRGQKVSVSPSGRNSFAHSLSVPQIAATPTACHSSSAPSSDARDSNASAAPTKWKNGGHVLMSVSP